jgi:lipopolysaccharide export system permease protein
VTASPVAAKHGIALHVTILDRYLVSELAGPGLFGLSVFTLIFVATQMLQIGHLVSEEHAPLGAALEYFLWQMPYFLVYVIPMSMLLGTLLSMQRLSGESEITAMKAGGISLTRIVTPLLIVGFVVSLFALFLQEILVPAANARANYIKAAVIEHLNPAVSNLSVVTPFPDGGRQITIADALDPATQSLLGVTVILKNKIGDVESVVVSPRAHYDAPSWTFFDATSRAFGPHGSVGTTHAVSQTIDIGENPSQIARHTSSDPEQLSRNDIKQALGSGQLSPQQILTYTATYASKLARPFAAFVFTLIAVSFGLRPVRGGGAGLGFGLAVAIVFTYYVISTLFLSIGELATWSAGIAAWTPNAIFTLIGLYLLRRASTA